MINHRNGSVTFTSCEIDQLEKAYMGLYNLIEEFPTSLSDFFPKEDYLNIVRWSRQIQGSPFEEYWYE